MMNLHALARGVTVVNPDRLATLRRSAGYVQDSSYAQVPKFIESTGMIQVQGVTSEELKQLDGLNVNDKVRKVYLGGEWDAVSRQQVKGGDQMIFEGFAWKVIRVAETWPEWTSVFVTILSPVAIEPNPTGSRP